jgi:hypothetical protein
MATSFFRVALSPLPLEGRGFGGGVSDVAMALKDVAMALGVGCLLLVGQRACYT